MGESGTRDEAGVDPADDVRRALLLAVGHGLRTPIASAKAAAAGLHIDDKQLPDADARELVSIIEDSLDRLNSMVDDVLTLGQIAAGCVAPAHDGVDLADAIDLAVATLRAGGLVRREFPLGRAPWPSQTQSLPAGSWST